MQANNCKDAVVFFIFTQSAWVLCIVVQTFCPLTATAPECWDINVTLVGKVNKSAVTDRINEAEGA